MQHFKSVAVVNQIMREFFRATWSLKIFKKYNLNRVKMNKMLQSTLVRHWMMNKARKIGYLNERFI